MFTRRFAVCCSLSGFHPFRSHSPVINKHDDRSLFHFIIGFNHFRKRSNKRQPNRNRQHTHETADRKTHLTPYIRIFIGYCAIINVILLISNHLLLPCHINRYRRSSVGQTPSNILCVSLFLRPLFSWIEILPRNTIVWRMFNQKCYCLFD